ncbi:hypothetical protein EJB05_44008, partial [Eragrostis curvula]
SEGSPVDSSANGLCDNVKINVDAAVSKNMRTSTAAAIARDENGVFLGVSALIIDVCSDPETLEACQCREGIIQEIESRTSAFEVCEIVHEGRASYVDAHTIARNSVYFGVGRQVWFLNPQKA